MNDEVSRINRHRQPTRIWTIDDEKRSHDMELQAMSWRVLLSACCEKDVNGLGIPLNIQDLRVSEPLVAVAELR